MRKILCDEGYKSNFGMVQRTKVLTETSEGKLYL